MKIGRLNDPDSGLAYTLTTWRVGGKIACAPDEVQDGIMKWNWKTTMQTGVELQFCFEKPVFAASVALSLRALDEVSCLASLTALLPVFFALSRRFLPICASALKLMPSIMTA